MKYSIDELRKFGFSDEQIAAINRTARYEDSLVVDDDSTVVDFPNSEDSSLNNAVKKIKDIPVGPLLTDKPVRAYTDYDVTDVTKLTKIKDSKIVELPAFGDGTKFIARLRRPSMLKLCKSGKIPNSLLNQATALFTDSNASRKVSITEIYDICEIICESAFVNPSYEEIKASGIELTDEQVMAVFQYTQGGVKALEKFCNE